MKLVYLSLFAASIALGAEPLREATVQSIVNQVRVLDLEAGNSRTAKNGEKITASHGVRTGIRSRAELLFQDETLIRLGAETFFAFKKDSRDVKFDAGSLLLQVPKDHGGAKIRTGAVTASVTGTTILMEHVPNAELKMLVLEGEMRVSITGRLFQSVTLKPGQLLSMNPTARSLPKPFEVDIGAIMRSSQLTGGGDKRGGKNFRPLPSAKLIEKAASGQSSGGGGEGGSKKKKKGAAASSAPLDIVAGQLKTPPPVVPAARPPAPPPVVVTPPKPASKPPVTDPHIRPGAGGNQ